MNIPEILPCPNPECGAAIGRLISLQGAWLECSACGYSSPKSDSVEKAIRLHNAICRPLQPPGVFTASDVSALLNRRQPTPADEAYKAAVIYGSALYRSEPTPEAADETPATAWLITTPYKNGKVARELVMSPLTDETYMDEGSEAIPLYTHPPKPEPTEALAEMEARKDAAYLERNQVVAALAKCFPSGIARTTIEGWSADWHGCVYIDLPTGQASWHYHDSHAYLFSGLPPYAGSWDGHSTEEKYRRVAALVASPKPPAEWMKEAAREIVSVTVYGGLAVPMVVGDAERIKLIDAIIAKHFQHAPKVPEGFKLVPVEPTNEMLLEGSSQCSGTEFETSWEVAANVYRQMLAAVEGHK